MSSDLKRRLTDRSFLLAVIATIAVWIAASRGVITYQQAVEASQLFIGGFIGAEKLKDAVGLFASGPKVPDTVSAGGDVNLSTQAVAAPAIRQETMPQTLELPRSQQPAPSSAPPDTDWAANFGVPEPSPEDPQPFPPPQPIEVTHEQAR